jgi:hypothetical protein
MSLAPNRLQRINRLMKADHNSPVSDSKISERVGGPFGQLANRRYTLLPPLYVLIVLAAVTYSFGYLLDFSCVLWLVG